MYVVKSEFVKPRGVNLVGKNYVVSELENAVELIDRINTLHTQSYVCDVVYRCVVTFHAIYIGD